MDRQPIQAIPQPFRLYPRGDQRSITDALNVILIDSYAIFVKTKNFQHVAAPHFRDYRLMLDEEELVDGAGNNERRPQAPSLVRRLMVEAHAVWLAVRDPRTPWHARAFGLLVAAYALSPIDLIPDFIPVLGLLDDAVLIPLGIWLFVKMLPPGVMDEHRTTAAVAAERPRPISGALLVLLLWLAAAAAVAAALAWNY